MKKREKDKRRLSITAALMWRFTAVVLGLWLLAMGWLTVLSAQQLYDQWRADTDRIAYEYADGSPVLDRSDMVEYEPLGVRLEFPLYQDHSYAYTDEVQHYEQRQYFFDDSGVLQNCDGSYLLVQLEQERYGTVILNGGVSSYIDLQKVPAELEEFLRENDASIDEHILCFTGYFEKEELIPVKAAWIHKMYPVMFSPDQQDWQVLFDHSEMTDRQLITVYTDWFEVADQLTSPLTANDQKFSNLEELAEAAYQHYLREGNSYINEEGYLCIGSPYDSDSLWDAVRIRSSHYCGVRLDLDGRLTEDESRWDENYTGTVVTVTHCYPMKSAMLRLVQVYVVSFMPVAALLLFLWRRIRKSLTTPLRQILRYGKYDYAMLPDTCSSRWREPYQLEQGYEQLQKDIHTLRQENKLLQTKLEYAQNVEENRRRMVSNITHELKTPLAVIHSYAEGLSENIAEEKREQYLNVILDEAEQMDSMVLEMLDLSRLEAGRVRLRQERFCLLELVHRVVQKMELLLKEKSLTVEYGICEEFDILADEDRMEQVITNFVSNAVKYTPEGGKISIRVFQHGGKTCFMIENQCQSLETEALEHIWDSFYRTSSARSSEGTGLGLAIAKAIIELHRGTCRAVNTQTGVEFRFELPQ